MSIRRAASVAIAFALALAPTLAFRVLGAAPAIDDAYVVNEDETLAVAAPGVLENDEPDPGSVCVVGVDVDGLEGRLVGDTGWRTDGSFTYRPWADWNGETSFVYGMKSVDGDQCIGPALGQATVRITVRPVNDPPTAVVAGSCEDGVTVAQDSGPYSDPSHCVENHNWGPVDEVTQYLSAWVVTTNHPELFSSAPKISVAEHAFGELHFTPATGAHGVASVSVRARDDGGTAHGGKDLSPVISFDITIVPPKATPEPTPAPDPTVEPSASAEATLPSDTAEPTAAPSGSPTSGFSGNGWVLVIGVLVVALALIGIAAPTLLRRARRAP